jgi:hypothetical protein
MKRFTLALAGLLLIATTVASAQAVPAYARSRFETYLANVSKAPFPNRGLSGFNYNGKALLRMMIDTAYVKAGTGLVCTVDFKRDIYFPFVYADADTVTASMKLFNEYDDITPTDFSVASDSFAFGIPTFGRRFVFTVASADTVGEAVAFYVIGFGIPVYSY